MSTKVKNRFTDSFKILGAAAQNVQNLGTQVTNVLNRLLPSRILSKANIFNLAVDVSQDLATMVMLHVEDSLVENNILIAQKEISVRGLAQLSGHQAVRPISSKGVLKLVFNPKIQLVTPTIVINNPKFKCATNNLFYVKESAETIQFPSNIGTIYIPVVEGSWVQKRFVANGLQNEIIRIDDLLPIAQNGLSVMVNNESWSIQDSLYDMGSDTKGVYAKNGISNQIDICFGDNVHGKSLSEGDVIIVDYITCAGETGNVANTAQFSATSGFFNTEGLQFDIADYCTISVESGFILGSNGEHIERTRQLAGFNSRALVFVRPENIKSYLSRLSIISHVEAWTEQDDKVFNLMILPNIKNKIGTYRDYLTLSDENLTLTAKQAEAIITYIDESGSQLTSSEIVMHQPTFDKYAVFVYVQTNSINKQLLKEQIESVIAETVLRSTFLDEDFDTAEVIPQSSIIDALWSINDIQQLSIDVVSELNEIAKINGFYETSEIEYVGSVKRIVTRTVTFDPLVTNPNLGFDELGGITTGSKKRVPVLRANFQRWSPNSEPVLLQKPIYIFYKTANGYEELS